MKSSGHRSRIQQIEAVKKNLAVQSNIFKIVQAISPMWITLKKLVLRDRVSAFEGALLEGLEGWQGVCKCEDLGLDL